MFKNIGTNIIKEGIFERFPELTPAVGEPNYYKGEHSKLLLIGESNYFTDDFESKCAFKNAEKWYHGEGCNLIPEDEEIKHKVSNWVGGGRFNNIFNSMKGVLEEAGVTDYNKENPLCEAAYYNYFLRPASVKILPNGKKDLGFKKDLQNLDCKVAYLALRGIIEKIKPNIVIFLSSLAWKWFTKYYDVDNDKSFTDDIVLDFVYHFSNPRTWNHKNGNGRQKFENLLIEHWIKDKPAYYYNFKKLRHIHLQLKQEFNVEKEVECFFENNILISKLDFKVNNCHFSCQTEIEKNSSTFFTYFYSHENCGTYQFILEANHNDFSDDTKSEIIIAEIRHMILKVINGLSSA
jgi:hypothetical protein